VAEPGAPSRPRLATPRPVLCLVTNRRLCERPLPEVVAAAVAGGVDWVQLREKDLDAAALLELADAVARATAGASVRLVLNRRLDVALALPGWGVQLGFDAVDPAAARRLLGPTRLVGVSAHAAAEVAAAAAAGADYATLAPIHPPLSKPASAPPLGLAPLREAARALPVLAQGGIDAERAAAALEAGALGVAVTGTILSASDPGDAAARLRAALDGAARPAAG